MASGLVWLIVIVLAVAIAPTSRLANLQSDALLALAAAVFCLLMMWFANRLLTEVSVYGKGINIGRVVIPLVRIETATIASVPIMGTVYSVLQFYTTSGRCYKLALSKK